MALFVYRRMHRARKKGLARRAELKMSYANIVSARAGGKEMTPTRMKTEQGSIFVKGCCAITFYSETLRFVNRKLNTFTLSLLRLLEFYLFDKEKCKFLVNLKVMYI